MSLGAIELNIRLDVREGGNSDTDIARRAAEALALLGTCAHHRADFLVNGAPVPHLVAGRAAGGWTVDALYLLAVRLHQECIAVYHPAQDRGELVGPGASVWGAFDLAKFKRLDPHLAYAVALGCAWDASHTARHLPRR